MLMRNYRESLQNFAERQTTTPFQLYRTAALGRLRSNVRIGEFYNWASCYPSIVTAAIGQHEPSK